MEKAQAIHLLQRLEAVYPKNPFSNPLAREEYIKLFLEKPFDIANRAIDEVLLQCNFFPTLAELHNKYQDVIRCSIVTSDESSNTGVLCFVCMDKGYLIIKRYMGDHGIAAYCPECEAGKQNFYDGSKLKDLHHRSKFITPPISEFFDLYELKKQNRAEWESAQKNKS